MPHLIGLIPLLALEEVTVTHSSSLLLFFFLFIYLTSQLIQDKQFYLTPLHTAVSVDPTYACQNTVKQKVKKL